MSASALIAEVAVAAPLKTTLAYLVPPALREQVQVGARLQVPLGRRQATGFVLRLAAGEAEGLKPIGALLDAEPLFPETLVPLFRRAADYYLHPIGNVIRTALPAGLGGAGAPPILSERYYRPAPQAPERAPRGERQQELLAAVRQAGELPLEQLRARFGAPHAPLNRLVALGYLVEERREKLRDPFLSWAVAADTPPELTPAQAAALAALDGPLRAGGFSPALLFGVTGSGKTEVYLRAIAAVLAAGRQALVLVPEIALTPQLVGRFRARFRGARQRIAVLHSGLSDGERYDAWRTIARGEAEIVIGARSAVFAPLPRPGIIVVDEEHEASYKQSEGFRYHARDLALLRGQLEQLPVLLGSATPALTSFQRASGGQTLLLELDRRAGGQPLPQVELIDMTGQEFGTVLSAQLDAALEENLAAGGQSLLLLNRRGFAPYLLCADCGLTFRCPNCEITLTYHRGERALRCHYCDFHQGPPELCPRCRGNRLDPEGVGTERLEAQLQERFPQARVARMDRDAMSAKGAHRALVEAVAAGAVDILVGTQMVAKGHDFPGVTLVGVVNADATLNFPDFRAAERTFALLAQVAGRAGRGDRPGRVLVQTYAPEHYALQAAAGHDYRAFCREETGARAELGYPPYGHLVNLVCSGNRREQVEEAAAAVAHGLGQAARGSEVLGPAPCLLTRLRGRWRYQLLLKAAQRSALRELLPELERLSRELPAGVQLAVDVDPVDMF